MTTTRSVLVLAVLSTLACGVDVPKEPAQLVLENQCSESVHLVHVWACDETNRGRNLIPEGQVLQNGQSFVLSEIEPGCYNVYAESISYAWQELAVDFSPGESEEYSLPCSDLRSNADEATARPEDIFVSHLEDVE